MLLVLYVPYLNTVVFHHQMPTWEFGMAVAGLAVFILLTLLWKLVLRRRCNQQCVSMSERRAA